MKFTFTSVKHFVGPEELDALEGVRRDTFLIAIQMLTGEEFAKPSDWCHATAKELDERADEQGAAAYEIEWDGGENLLMWHFSSDDGSLFGGESGALFPVHMVQGHFQIHSAGPPESICGSLGTAFESRPRST